MYFLGEIGEDGFNDLSKLIVESLMELPTYIPQVTLRWTEKTPYEVFRYVHYSNFYSLFKKMYKVSSVEYADGVNDLNKD